MITVSKELLLNLGNYSNIKIIVSVSADNDDFEAAWSDVNQQVAEQEAIEKATRLNPIPTMKEPPKGFVKVDNDMPF